MCRIEHLSAKIHISGKKKHLSSFEKFVLILAKSQGYFSIQYE